MGDNTICKRCGLTKRLCWCNCKRLLIYTGQRHTRWLSIVRIDDHMQVKLSTVGAPELTLDQWERFFRKGLALVEDARKVKQ